MRSRLIGVAIYHDMTRADYRWRLLEIQAMNRNHSIQAGLQIIARNRRIMRVRVHDPKVQLFANTFNSVVEGAMLWPL